MIVIGRDGGVAVLREIVAHPFGEAVDAFAVKSDNHAGEGSRAIRQRNQRRGFNFANPEVDYASHAYCRGS